VRKVLRTGQCSLAVVACVSRAFFAVLIAVYVLLSMAYRDRYYTYLFVANVGSSTIGPIVTIVLFNQWGNTWDWYQSTHSPARGAKAFAATNP
jgi:hypothetical protein